MNPYLLLPFLLVSHPSKWGEKVILSARVEVPPTLDGILTDPAWANARFTTGFTQKEPDEGKPATEKTYVYSVYDDENIYFAFNCRDSEPDKIEARLIPRESNEQFGESVAILLDTYHDHRTAYEFQTNPFGVQVDSRRTEDGQNRDYSWDGIWDAEGRITSQGWTLEIKIPFKTLRFQNEDPKVWGVNFWRYIFRKNESTWWSPVTRADGKSRVSKFGHLLMLQDILPGSHLEFRPYITSQMATHGENSTGNLEWINNLTPSKGETLDMIHSGGADLKWGVTSNVITDITLNPDFGEVEADPEVINLSRYPTDYEEKRPFFTERGDYFKTPLELFYSRRIGIHEDGLKSRIIGALKITGKEEGTSIGFIGAGTEETFIYGGADTIPSSAYSVFRIKQDVFQNSSLGFLFASKDTKDGYGRSGGLDLDLNLFNNFNLTGQIARTLPQRKEKWGRAGEVNFMKRGTLLNFGLFYRDIDSRFDASPTGFVPWIGTKEEEGWVTYHPFPRRWGVRQLTLTSGALRSRLYQDPEWSQSGWGEIFLEFENQWSTYGGTRIGHSYILEVDTSFGTHSIWSGFTTDWRKPVFLEVTGSQSREFNYARDSLGTVQIFGIFPNIKISGNLTCRIGVENTREYKEDGTPYSNGSTWIGSQRLQYTATRNLSFRFFVQQNLSENPETQRFTINKTTFNGLMEWRYHPGSILYFAYNDFRDFLTGKEITKDQILLFKISYLFRI